MPRNSCRPCSVIQDHLGDVLNKRGLLSGSDRRVAESARRRRRLRLTFGHRRQDQIGTPEAWPKKVSSPSRDLFCFTIASDGVRPAACDAAGRHGHAGARLSHGACAQPARRAKRATLQAELGLSGRAAGQRLRGRVLAGLVPRRAAARRCRAVRQPGVHPGRGWRARHAAALARSPRRAGRAPEEILNALIGVRLGPDDLRAMLSGCVKAVGRTAAGARATVPTGSRSILPPEERFICVAREAPGVSSRAAMGDWKSTTRVCRRSAVADRAARHGSRPRGRAESGRGEWRPAARRLVAVKIPDGVCR